ncbi:S-layer homology domain-containing protein [Paenibacillus polymyxa]|uniref:OmpL47-type beta-barrel domain-containing protein n=1 Tax=Paenibacillus polymyxa TaxID=1406 RepID=UPI002AB3F5DB|nr:S-layer homology domain-containing protein [Paenibacillus polymyxa]MDY7989827.1 S-layer homology domain-containing protein [Paenibacillus polymyxa]MDY8116814.1 S-layer homology domain-containing protein [Paenibacillus polymyxa]
MRSRWFTIFLVIMITVAAVVPVFPGNAEATTYYVGQTWEVTNVGSSYTFDLGSPGFDRKDFNLTREFSAYTSSHPGDFTFISEYYSQDGITWYKNTETETQEGTTSSSIGGLILENRNPEVTYVRYYRFQSNKSFTELLKLKVMITGGPYSNDTKPPTKPTVQLNPNGATQSNVQVTIGGSTDDRLLKGYEYKLEGATQQDWTFGVNFTISNEGDTTITARAVDYNNNKSPETTALAKIDRSPPGAPTIITDRTGWSNTAVNVTVQHGYDAGSGVRLSQYRLSGATNQDWRDYTGSISIQNTGVTTVNARTTDNLGQIGTESSKEVWVDTIAPNPPSILVDNTNWSSKRKKFTIQDGQDSGGSGVLKSQYKIGNGSWIDYVTPVTVEENVKIDARTLDKAGNVSAGASSDSNIDKTPPTAPTILKNPDGDTAGNVEITITPGTDTLSGIKNTEYRVGTSSDWQTYTRPFNITIEGEHQVFSRSTDKAGNISVIANETVLIDRTPPTAPSITLSTDNYTQSNVQFTISGSTDTRSFHYEYKLGNESYRAGEQGTVTEDGLTVITARAVDTAGNASAETTKTVRIDKRAPAIRISPSQRGWSTDPITATTQYTDDGSGVNPNRRYYKISSSPDEPESWELANSNNFSVKIAEEGTWYIHAKVEDNVGNSATASSSAMHVQQPPEAPVLSIQSIGVKEAALQWTLPGGHTYTDGYQYILRNLTNGQTMNVTYPGDRVLDASLSAGTNYEYELSVRNHVGEAVSRKVHLLTLPAAPTNLILTPVERDATQITASFDPVQSARQYRIIAYNMATQQEVYNQTVTNSVYQPVLNLQPGMVYNVAVSAINETGEGAATNQSILTLPSTPGGFKSVSIGENRVDLAWHTVTSATYYVLERDQVPVTEAVYEGFTDFELSSGTVYDYALYAVNPTGPGAYSYLNVLTLPGPVNGLTVVGARRNDLMIAWSRVHGAAGYRIVVNGVQEYRVGADEHETTLPDLPAGTPAQITIQAFNSSGLGVTSDTYGLTLPEQPMDVNVSDIQEHSATISWTPVHGATKYEVSLNGQKYAISDTMLAVDGLEAGTVYPFSVIAGNTSGWGEARTGQFLTLPSQVVGFSAQQPHDKGFILSWEPVKSANQYIVYQGEQELGTTTEPRFKITDLQPGTNYEFQVVAVNATGMGKTGAFNWRTYPSNPQSGDVWVKEITTSSAVTGWKQIPGADYYHVYLDGELHGDTMELNYTFKGFASSETHEVKIEPVNSSGIGISSSVSFETLPDGSFTVDAKPQYTSIAIMIGDTKPNDIIVISHDGEIIYKGKDTLFIWETVKSGTKYDIEIWTENSNGVKSEVQVVSTRTLSRSKPTSQPSSDEVIPPVIPNPLPAIIEPATPAPIQNKNKAVFKDIDRVFNGDKIQELADRGILKGTSDTTFEPYREVRRAEFTSMLVRALKLPEELDTKLSFDDIKPEDWYIPELKTAIKYVVARGFSETVFAPDMLISREQASKMLGNVVKPEEIINFQEFYQDETAIAVWAKTEVLGLTRESLLQGYPDGSFRPKQPVTRAEAAEMIFNLLQDKSSIGL